MNDDVMAKDFTLKFSRDLDALILRSAAIMVPELGMRRTSVIVLAGLAGMGFKVERDSEVGPGKFLEVIEMTVKEMNLRRKARAGRRERKQ